MKCLFKSEKGFTLVEVMITVLILASVWIMILASFMSYRYVVSYAKHKVQAIYVAQRILEEKRRQAFSGLVSQNYGTVSIDTKGTFSSAADDFTGNGIITVTTLDTYRKRVQVEVNWRERSPVGTVTMREYCTTDIANDTQLK